MGIYYHREVKKPKKILFCQFSTNFLYKKYQKNIASLYYEGIYKYKQREGYYKNKDFWEIPLWIAEATAIFSNRDIKELHIIKDIQKTIEYINNSQADYILFSVLDINKNYIFDIIKTCKSKVFIIGGYVNFDKFKSLKHCKIFNSMQELHNIINIDVVYGVTPYKYKTDYALFKNMKIIPRLVLSTGCKNKCRFCTIENKIKEKTKTEVFNQVKSFKDLKFKLVYINDKTYGQAKNYQILKEVYQAIKSYNRDFKGFIIQTTAIQLNNINFVKELKSLGVYIVEIGVESFNNKLLRRLKKPQNEKIINRAINNLKQINIKITCNIIIGIIGENKKTYNKTLTFLKQNKDDIFLLNVYNLAIYDNTELSKELKNNNDNNELELKKSFYSNTQNNNNKGFYDEVFNLGLNILQNKKD